MGMAKYEEGLREYGEGRVDRLGGRQGTSTP